MVLVLRAHYIEGSAELPSITHGDEVGYSKVVSSEMLPIAATMPSGTLPNP